MRVEPHGVGSVVHVVKRGVRGLEIVRDARDKKRFVETLYYLNDTFSDHNWLKAIASVPPWTRPDYWPEREPLVHILAWTLVPNHFHLLLQEVQEGGVAKFMQRICISMAMTFNLKYQESGSIFQSSYRGKTVQEDTHLRYLAFYIQVKNVLEQRPGGLQKTLSEFDDAWEWALRFKYSSLGSYMGDLSSPIVEHELLSSLFPDANQFKSQSYELLSERLAIDDDRTAYILESW